jgi:5-methylcytosine-specific restriction endonuclease McrA
MAVTAPASLDSTALSRRLGELAGHERQVQLDFLLHLDEFDRRRAWAEAGYPSLWEYLLRVLHLREGAAGRRIAAMRVLRRFPVLGDALRDGRLSMSTAALLGPVLTDENCDEILARAAFMTRAETEHLVASLQPRTAPREGLRLLSPSRATPSRETPSPQQEPSAAAPPPHDGFTLPPEITPPPRPTSRPTLESFSATTYSLRVTVDLPFKQELDELKALLAHKISDGDLGAVLREAVRCALEKHGRRKGAAEPSRKPESAQPEKSANEKRRPEAREHIPAAIRREVWKRDGGRCAWRSADGHVCGSTWKLEIDHVEPVVRGGSSKVDNLRLTCFTHNQLHADRCFGRAHMERSRREQPRTGQVTSPGDSERARGEPSLTALTSHRIAAAGADRL